MNKFDGVANTLFVPLVARINISKKFPEYFMDEKALELEKYLPQGVDKGSSEYSNMASVARYYNMDKTVIAFAKSYAESNIVYLGAGLETAYDRLSDKIENRTVHWYETDLPEVIEARKKVFGQRKNETLIAGDMFKLIDQLIDGRPLYELVGEKVAAWGEQHMGTDYSYVGAVVGATYPEMGKVLRKVMPKAYILVPGYGAQGGKGKDLVHFFNEDGLGAIVNSSRGIIAAYKQEKYAAMGAENFGDASRAAVEDMIADIRGALENNK